MPETESNLVAHAKFELALCRERQPALLERYSDGELLAAVQTFADEDHSGGSAACVTGAMPEGVLRTLLRFEPLTPLLGTDDEWFVHDHNDRCYAQNKRCGHVFQRRDGTAYDINAVVFRDPDGSCWTNGDSAQDVTFPYMPATRIVDRPTQQTETRP